MGYWTFQRNGSVVSFLLIISHNFNIATGDILMTSKTVLKNVIIIMGKSVLTMRLVNLRAISYCTDQILKLNGHFAAFFTIHLEEMMGN